jgi:hypothetical protein
MTPDLNKTLLMQGAIGADAQDFLDSPLGRLVLTHAREEAREALSALRTVLPWRRRKIMELQNRVWRAEAFEGWLRQTVAIGKQALAEYDRRQDTMTNEDNENE